MGHGLFFNKNFKFFKFTEKLTKLKQRDFTYPSAISISHNDFISYYIIGTLLFSWVSPVILLMPHFIFQDLIQENFSGLLDLFKSMIVHDNVSFFSWFSVLRRCVENALNLGLTGWSFLMIRLAWCVLGGIALRLMPFSHFVRWHMVSTCLSTIGVNLSTCLRQHLSIFSL